MTGRPSLRTSETAFAFLALWAVGVAFLLTGTARAQKAIAPPTKQPDRSLPLASPTVSATLVEESAPAPRSSTLSPSPAPSGGVTVTASPTSAPSSVSPTPKVSGSPIPVTLPSGIVTTGSGNPTVIVVQQPVAPQEPPAGNSWVPGLLGIGLLVLIVFYGVRFARQKGLTVEGGLETLGVQMPQDGIVSTVPPRPSPVVEPPLPSLADLPPPQPAVTGATISAFKSKVAEPPSPPPVPEAGVRVLNPTLLGLSGSAVGELVTLSGPLSVGREAANTLPLPTDSTVSRRHARIDLENGRWVVTDLGSSNGTFVNGRRLTEPHPLERGDEVQFGSVRFRFDG